MALHPRIIRLERKRPEMNCDTSSTDRILAMLDDLRARRAAQRAAAGLPPYESSRDWDRHFEENLARSREHLASRPTPQ